MGRIFLTVVVLVGTCSAAFAAEPPAWVQKPRLTYDPAGRTWFVTFELDRPTDVEVAIVDLANSRVVRHLAAGVLGPKAPAPFATESLAQRLPWDGRDDDRQNVASSVKVAARVRAGMSVKLERIVGGDPYAYYSDEMGHDDHSPFGINGLELKSDGHMYVLGHSSNLGPPALRQYDSDGNYRRTVFPPPAGKDVASMRGWGINVRPDGTYSPQFNRLTDPSLTTTLLDTGTGGMARLLPTPDRDRLTLWRTGTGNDAFAQLTMHADGTISDSPTDRSPGPLVAHPPLALGPIAKDSHVVRALLGPIFTAYAPDGQSFYLSGAYGATTRYGSIQQIDQEGVWRDGQLWKVDARTRTARVFFALDKNSLPATPKERQAALGGTHSYAALHGVTTDAAGRVFVADRVNQRIVVLDAEGKIVREIPLRHADALAVSRRTGALYATVRWGDEHSGRGAVRLHKFADWRRDDAPTESIELCETSYTDHHKCSYLALAETDGATNVWTAYTNLPVRIYRDDRQGFRLLKDFYRVAGAQRCLGFDRLEVDQQTDEVYVLDDHRSVWKIGDWKNPRVEKTPLATACLAIDSRRRHVYLRTLADGSSSYSVGKVARFHLDGADYSPANFGETGTNRLTPSYHHEWCFTGNGDKGLAIAPNGNVAIVGDPRDGLRVFAGSEERVPWEATTIARLPDAAGGVRFDRQGNLYVGFIDKRPAAAPSGFEQDRFATALGRIFKFAPTGTLESGRLFPTAPDGPTTIYDVPYGAFDTDCITRSPRFAVDGYGRIYYPTNIAQRVSVIDNAGNGVLQFGAYGNRDSTGGLPGDLVPTRDIPLGFPNSVDATDDYIYVGDMVNQRLLRIAKIFALTGQSSS